MHPHHDQGYTYSPVIKLTCMYPNESPLITLTCMYPNESPVIMLTCMYPNESPVIMDVPILLIFSAVTACKLLFSSSSVCLTLSQILNSPVWFIESLIKESKDPPK